jgi:hypothetical protein
MPVLKEEMSFVPEAPELPVFETMFETLVFHAMCSMPADTTFKDQRYRADNVRARSPLPRPSSPLEPARVSLLPRAPSLTSPIRPLSQPHTLQALSSLTSHTSLPRLRLSPLSTRPRTCR